MATIKKIALLTSGGDAPGLKKRKLEMTDPKLQLMNILSSRDT